MTTRVFSSNIMRNKHDFFFFFAPVLYFKGISGALWVRGLVRKERNHLFSQWPNLGLLSLKVQAGNQSLGQISFLLKLGWAVNIQ